MSNVEKATESFLAEYPERQEAIRTLLTVDADHPTWEFADVDIDTGVFGEVVSRGIVEQHDGGYRLTDRDATARALSAESLSSSSASATPDQSGLPVSMVTDWLSSMQIPSTWTYRKGSELLLAILVVIAFRVVTLPLVFQRGYVVSVHHKAG